MTADAVNLGKTKRGVHLHKALFELDLNLTLPHYELPAGHLSRAP